MRWRQSRQSRNIEDRRGMGIPRGARIGGASGIGILVVLVLAVVFGLDPGALLEDGSLGEPPSISVTPDSPQGSPGEDDPRQFVAAVLGETEDTWHALFEAAGRTYEPPKLVLFSHAVDSACGFGQAAMGPFYCPLDRKVYLDLGFFEELRSRFGASGDFAQAYVIAHEVGHHVQNLVGIAGRVREMQSRTSRAEGNMLSVRLELQADCLAGVWAHRADKARQILETGDIEEGLNAASAIGDDRIQRRTQGQVVPESFTHGSSAQRVRWFRQGLEEGVLEACDTFRADRL